MAQFDNPHIIQYNSHMTDEIPNWAKDFTPRQNAPKATTDDKFPCKACGYTGPIKTDLNSPTALKGLAIEVLVQIVETAPRNVSLVAAIRELIDRVEGKAPQSINLDVKDTRMDRMPIDELIYLASLKREPLLIAPMPENPSD